MQKSVGDFHCVNSAGDLAGGTEYTSAYCVGGFQSTNWCVTQTTEMYDIWTNSWSFIGGDSIAEGLADKGLAYAQCPEGDWILAFGGEFRAGEENGFCPGGKRDIIVGDKAYALYVGGDDHGANQLWQEISSIPDER